MEREDVEVEVTVEDVQNSTHSNKSKSAYFTYQHRFLYFLPCYIDSCLQNLVLQHLSSRRGSTITTTNNKKEEIEDILHVKLAGGCT
jgi:hypothetical protein